MVDQILKKVALMGLCGAEWDILLGVKEGTFNRRVRLGGWGFEEIRALGMYVGIQVDGLWEREIFRGE